MKKSNLKLLLLQTSAVALAAVLAGCASANYKKGDSAASSLTSAANAITVGQAKIETALTNLNDLVNNPQGDLVAGFNKFNAAVKSLQATSQDVSRRVTEMRKTGNDYFQQWDQQLATIQNEDIKNRSAARKDEMEKKFADVKRSYTEVHLAFEPFLRDLKDIQTALGTDLTSGGVAAIRGVVDKANRDGEVVRSAAQQLSAHFKDLGVAMSATPSAQ